MGYLPVRRISVGLDFVLLYFKNDVPCFQFTGFSKADQAQTSVKRELLRAIIQLADQAEEITQNLSDKYKAQHNLKSPTPLRQGPAIRVPLWNKDTSVYISVYPTYTVIPAVWYNSGNTQVSWGRFEAAVRTSISL